MMSFVLWQIGVHDNKYAPRAPSAKVSAHAYLGPPFDYTTITCYPSTYSKPGTKDLASFSAGQEIMFLAADYDKLSNPIETYAIHSVNASSNTLRISGVVTTPPVDGCILEYADFDACTSAQQSGRVFMADPKHVLGTSDASAFKYM